MDRKQRPPRVPKLAWVEKEGEGPGTAPAHKTEEVVLLPLLDHDNSQVQLLSIQLFRTVVTLPQEKENESLKAHVRQSLLPLFFHCHDENQRVAEASQETLLCAAEFLKRRDLEKLVKSKKLWKFTESWHVFPQRCTLCKLELCC